MKPVLPMQGVIVLVGEMLGRETTPLKLGELVSIGPRVRREEMTPGALVVYNQSRILDHFKDGEQDILVLDMRGVLAVVTDTYLAQNPQARVYGRALI